MPSQLLPAARAAMAALLLAAVPAAGAAPAKQAPAAAKKAAPAKRAAARPAPAPEQGVLRLEIAPAEFTLDGPRATVRLLVTAVHADGATRDVTDQAVLTLSNAAVAAVRGGVAVPRADGRATVTARLGRLVSAPASLTVRGSRAAAPVEFVNDVMPVLARAGCNNTACHGSPAGKGGLKLSLFGYEPELDHAALVKDAGGKRVDAAEPARSLLLRKATAAVPHGGGQRFKPESREYAALAAWMKEGTPGLGEFEPRVREVRLLPEQPWIPAPGAKQRLLALATMTDGTVRDVTERALFSSDDDGVADVSAAGVVTAGRAGEAAVMVRYLGQVAVSRVAVLPAWKLERYPALPAANAIDSLVQAKLKKLRVLPSDPCTDAEFIRRASLDTLGIIPTPEEVRAFLADPAPDRRARLVDRLLERPEFVDLWTMKWNDTLRNSPRTLRYSSDAYGAWIREQVAANRPYDAFARDLLTASGSPVPSTAAAGGAKQKKKAGPAPAGVAFNPAASYFLVARDPLDIASAASQVFMGVRIECARCHNHPFERWTQNDFYGFAAFFTGVGGQGRAKNGQAVVVNPRAAPLRLPKSNAPAEPRVLDGAETAAAPGGDARVSLAAWLTAPENPYFARSMANRIWGHYFGRGIVEPVDDFRVTNPPSNPELLDALARELVQRRFDVKAVHRLILNSRTYQQSSKPNRTNREDTRNFARFYPKRLMAEQLYDSISQATAVFLSDGGSARGRKRAKAARQPATGGAARVMQLPTLTVDRRGGASGPVQFLETFGKPRRESVCECERSSDGNMAQALALLNGDEVNEKIAASGGRVQQLVRSGKPDPEVVEEIYLAALSRRPTPRQMNDALELIRAAGSRAEGIEDLAWSLLNCREFLFVH